MTEILYMPSADSNYIKDFEAEVLKKGTDFVVLNRTVFYAEGGGQPTDTGSLRWETSSSRVLMVRKKGELRHHLEGALPDVGTMVLGELDWERRYSHMRMHTSQHILSAVVFGASGGVTVGNQIHADHSRVDFAPVPYTMADAGMIQEKVNGIFKRGIPVMVEERERKELEDRIDQRYINMSLIPAKIKRLRTIMIGEVDICPCAGTHVRNTSEIGSMRITRIENKGKDRVRIVYELDPPM